MPLRKASCAWILVTLKEVEIGRAERNSAKFEEEFWELNSEKHRFRSAIAIYFPQIHALIGMCEKSAEPVFIGL